MAVRQLPDATWPKDPNDSGSSPPTSDPGSPSQVSQQPSVIQETLSGSGSVIPIVYGTCRLGGMVTLATTYSNDLVLCVVWCMGEVNAISVKFNDDDEDLPAGMTLTTYLGTTSQPVDPTLAAAIPGYADRLIYTDPKYGSVGIAYSVIRVPPNLDGINGIPRLSATIQGRKVYCCVANGYVYSANPANVIADLIRDPILGMRRQVDYSSQIALQSICNEVMADGNKRREIHLALTSAQDIVQWLETLRGYAGCMLFFEGDKAVLVPNRPVGSTIAVTADKILKGSMSVTKRPTSPNVVRVAYTDITAQPWRTNYALVTHPDVDSGAAAWNEETISMPGIQNYGQAYREALERLNSYRYCDMDVEFTMTDEGLRITSGDVISLTHPIGFTNATFRIETVNAVSPGRWRITASKYSALAYAGTEAPIAPAFPNIKPPSSEDGGITDTPGSSLSLTEILTILSDGTPISKIQATWVASTHPNLSKYEIQWKAASASGWNTDFSSTATWLSPQVAVANVYTVRVRTVATDGAVGTWLEGTINITGKTSTGWGAPSAPSGVTGNLYVELTWAFPPNAEDISHTEVWMATSNNFAAATLVAKVTYPGNKYLHTGLAAGQCRFFWVKFVDTSKNVTGTYPTGSTSGIQLCTPTTGSDMLSYLTGQIQDSHLNSTLSTSITRASEDANQALVEVGQLSNEVYGEYYVKIDVNGRVAGYGLANDATEGSLFLVKVDRFAVGAPGAASSYPFIVSGGQVYMTSAYIQDATIQNAKIANLTLTNGKIGYNQLSSLSGGYNGTVFSYPTTRTVFCTSVVIDASNAYTLGVFFEFALSPGLVGISDVGGVTNMRVIPQISASGGYTGAYDQNPFYAADGVYTVHWNPYMSPDPTRGNVTFSFSLYVEPTQYYSTLNEAWFSVTAYSANHLALVTAYTR